MKGSISQRSCQWVLVGQLMAVVGLVLLSHSGRVLESSGGWVACPAQMMVAAEPQRKAKGGARPAKSWGGGWRRYGVKYSWDW